MKNIKLQIVGLLTILIFSECNDPNSPKVVPGRFPDIATNLSEVNSAYDDYNSAFPGVQLPYQLVFSSNRNSQGTNFDIIYKPFMISWSYHSEMLDFTFYNSEIDSLFSLINTDGNEFGPNLFFLNYEYEPGVYDQIKMVTYSTSDSADNYQTKLVYSKFKNNKRGIIYAGPIDLSIVNHESNAQYISLRQTNVLPIDIYSYNTTPAFSQIYFQADGTGQSDIFYANISDHENLFDLMTSETKLETNILTALSTPSEDKCPYVNGNLMVFTSDRPGGYGGYDLYYSFYENGHWTEPINFGEKINSTFDEFRPITVFADGFESDMMIFSSNRPGGKGGYDLYYVGLPFKFYQPN